MDEILNEQNAEIENSNQMYIDAINDLKVNSVSRERYDKIVEENRNLLNSLVNGSSMTAVEQPVQKKSLNELRNNLFRPEKELNNLEYVSRALELRDAVIEETGEDPFVGRGHYVTPNAESYATAEKVANVYRECIEYANGDSELFTQELMRRTRETGGLPKNKR